MNRIVIGKFVNTHGIKGEIRIKSNFKYKDRIFQVGNEIILDKPYIINGYRVHKDYDMVTLTGINSINDIIALKNSLVYIDRDKYLNNTDYLDEDLLNFKVYMEDKYIGNVSKIRFLNNEKKLIEVNKNLIPFELITKIEINNKKIEIKYLEGLIQ